MTPEKNCKFCRYGTPAGYRQVICQKHNKFEVELYSCSYWKRDERKLKNTVDQNDVLKHNN